MTLSPLHRAMVVLLMTAGYCSLSGQGVGTPGGNGRVPRLEFTHRAVGEPNELRIHGASPNNPIFLFVAHGENPTPLASAGLGPAVLGPDLLSPLGAVTFSHLMTSSAGEFTWTQPFSPLIAGVPIHFQAAVLDFGAPFGSVAFSEHRRLIFGFDREAHPIAADLGGGLFGLSEVFAHGSLAALGDPRLAGVTLTDLSLTNSNEMASGRDDRPTVDSLSSPARVIRLPGGFTLLGVRSTSFEDGLVLIHPDGRLETLVWLQGAATEPAIATEIAASSFDGWAAVLTEPALGTPQLLLVRVDGWNAIPEIGKHRAVPLPPGLAIDESSLCFLDGALFFGDGESELWRYDLINDVTSQVLFPPSNGLTPVHVDETCAPAEDGSALAIGAGQSETLHDIYVVTATGIATNLSQFPAAYEDSGPGQTDGIQLAMSPEGDWVAYQRTELTEETYVHATTPGAAPQHVTSAQQFIDSIDTVIGVGFRVNGRAVFIAGKELNEADAYRFDPTLNTVANITQSSGMSMPVYDLGSTLELTSRFSTPHYLVSELQDLNGSKSLVITDQAGNSQTLSIGMTVATVPRQDGTLIADRDPTGVFCLRRLPASGTAATTLWTSLAGTQLIAQGHDREGDHSAFLLNTGGSTQLVLVDAAGIATTHPGPMRTSSGEIAVESTGSVIAITTDPAGATTFAERWNPLTQTWSTVSGPFPTGSAGCFLR